MSDAAQPDNGAPRSAATPVVRKVFERPPSLVPAWVRAMTNTGKRPATDAASGTLLLPQVELELWPQRADPGHLQKYRKLCGFAQAQYLPITYPQLMAGPLHIHMLTAPEFPLPAAGIVHLGNRIEQSRRLWADDPIHFACHFRPARLTAKGVEVDLVTQGTVHGEPVWRSVMTILSRAVRDEEAAKARQAAPKSGEPGGSLVVRSGQPHRSLLVKVPEDIGRSYAALAGDFNPIHLHMATAKLFGFPRAIAHGMWTLARCLAECDDDLPAPAVAVDVRFNKPVLLPSTVLMEVDKAGSALSFVLSSRDGSKTHLSGAIQPIRPVSGGTGLRPVTPSES